MIEVDAAIVGGGFSGCAIAANLARSAPLGFSLAVFEPGRLGHGAAYGTRHRQHVLNTRAHAMSLHSSDPDHFVRWLGPRAGRMDFVSRATYGEYLSEAAARALERDCFMHVPDAVVTVRRLHREGFLIESSSGAQFRARIVVLATGNPLPGDDFLPLEMRLHPGYVGDPWRFDYSVVGGHVLVIGSGLTALDVLVALKGSGHRGTVHVLSRRGRFPEVHANVAPYDVVPTLDARSARALLRSFRRRVHEAAQRGFDWRAVVDAVRPESEAVWRRLGGREQQRFERHLRSQWERRRHRAPQDVDAVREEYQNSGRLFTYAGRLLDMQHGTVSISRNSGERVELRPDWIVNCSGVGRTASLRKDPLLATMIAQRLVAPDSHGLGLQVTSDLVALDGDGHSTGGLWIVGSAVRGSRFEATAVPELRVMAELVSSEILRNSRWEAGAVEAYS
jgi:uncharacterized NAD(P)/FAD-binding protein YdhS